MSAINDKYAALGGPSGFLGRPIDAGAGSGEMPTADGHGRCRDFEHGSIYWTPQTGAHEVHGDIRVKWAHLGGVRSFLGFPDTDELGTPDGRGRFNHFQGGSIYWTPDTGAHEVHGNIRLRWAELGWENSCLGYPISDEEPAGGDNRQSRFQHGIIVTGSNGPVETCY